MSSKHRGINTLVNDNSYILSTVGLDHERGYLALPLLGVLFIVSQVLGKLREEQKVLGPTLP